MTTLRLTEASHTDNEFYDLGAVQVEVPPEAFLAALPTSPPHDCATDDACFIVDLMSDDGTDLLDDREVTQQAADQLLNGALATHRAEARAQLAAVYATLATLRR